MTVYSQGLIKRICESVGCKGATVEVGDHAIQVNLPRGNTREVATALYAAFKQSLMPGWGANVFLEEAPKSWVRIGEPHDYRPPQAGDPGDPGPVETEPASPKLKKRAEEARKRYEAQLEERAKLARMREEVEIAETAREFYAAFDAEELQPDGHFVQNQAFSLDEYASAGGCDHGVRFDPEDANSLSVAEVRELYPRLDGRCPKGCGYEGIAYASREHYVYGDW